MKKPFALLLCLSSWALGSGCNLLDISDAEGTRGRGARAFDPYSSSASGAISLSLLAFNGCAILPNGEPVARGDVNLPEGAYPDVCTRLNDGAPLGPPMPPFARFNVTPGTIYFLREITLVDTVFGQHTEFNNRQAPATWARRQSRFKSLDWNGLTIGQETWRDRGSGAFQRETYFENAAWMISNNDSFLVEVLDSDGNARASQTYLRRDFLAENATTGRTRVSWAVDGLARPRFPDDPEPQPPGVDPIYQTVVKVSVANATNPFKSITMPDISGDGAIRVTWSLMPEAPFYFPVTFVPEQERPATCFRLGPDGLATDEQVPCGFGLEQAVRIRTPQNGRYYMPGETVDFMVSLRDGDGNGLHSRDLLPTYNEYVNGDSNGLAYFNDFMIFTYRDTSSSESGFKVVGPLQDLRVANGTYQLPYFSYPGTSEPRFFVEPGLPSILPGYADSQPPARYAVALPPDAKPGTYAIVLKGHRSYMGERLNRLDPFFFQVGQEQKTTYPERIGNCQVCHNGTNSLSNVHHGMAVDHVELCKTCHFEQAVGQVSDIVHRIHASSRKYSQNRADCTLCHLTRESTLRPSLMSCNGCHVQSHGTEYYDLYFAEMHVTPNAYGNCANACHAETPPMQHILPPQ
ncbi:hypothetical protein [Myxococcus xanthus]|uniref:hypothetical protein n=1 Tax=Myxococcus xanthus TaxID=34 RepID=UPI001127711B|nr:hypothetical protein [Myxococcus xanthus]QDE95821.1 hypothetical protein BHS05_07990 [Myxococcus xanthus]